MKVLLVIHGYPRRYNAGSEIYTQTLAHALVDAGCAVAIFAREEDAFLPDYHMQTESDPLKDEISVHLVNHARSNARFQNDHIDKAFARVIASEQPDVVHFGHLNHLSLGLPAVAKSHRLPVLFTLHDFWLMCPRGQFLQQGLSGEQPWRLCCGQDNAKCASRCYNRFIEGINPQAETQHWEQWIDNRMRQTRRACEHVDLFIAPSEHLLQRHVNEFGLDAAKTVYLNYGFNLDRYQRRTRQSESCHENEDIFVFGYIGRHHPSKGIHLLIDAFAEIKSTARLRIWGKTTAQTASLKRQAEKHPGSARRIEWLDEYRNEDIVTDVFNRCDCIVVPSIWDENSPLVIHEAQQCGVPVITADHGGMGEYVKHGENGLTFKHRDTRSLYNAMQRGLADRDALARMGKRGYLFSADGKVPSSTQHAAEILKHYQRLARPPTRAINQ